MTAAGKIKTDILLICAVFAAAVFMCSCGSVKTDENGSPRIVSASVSSYNEGTEDSQWIRVDLVFDREIKVDSDKKDTLRITITGERVKSDDFILEEGDSEDTVRLLIPTDATTKSILEITKAPDSDTIAAIQSLNDPYAAMDFELEAIVPSGVTLSTVESEPGKVVKSVDSYWSIRSIAWVGLSENGELVPVSETQTLEELDGYAAVHGHDFLIEDEVDIAGKIVDVLTANYSSEYTFSSEGNLITAEKEGSEDTLDIIIYEYVMIDQEPVSGSDDPGNSEDAADGADDTEQNSQTESESDPEDEESSDDESHSSVVKTTDIDRAVTSDEQAFLDKLHIAYIEEDGITDYKELYQTLMITGDAMPEEQVYSVRDLETLLEISFENQAMNAYGLPMEKDGYAGLDFAVFLDLCGADTEGKTLLVEDAAGTRKTYSFDELTAEGAELFLALGSDSGPLDSESTPVAGPVALCISYGGESEWTGELSRVIIGEGDIPEDPEYRFHNREPYLSSADITFTVEVYQEGAEYLGALKTVVFTTEELEQLMKDNPDAVVRSYYGTIGNEPLYEYLGAGGWFDCYEGIDLLWLLTEQVGINQSALSGRAELYGRDGEMYTTIDDLTYIREAWECPDEYYTMTTDSIKLTGTVPMIACVKNSYPILPEHDHESEAYVAYNTLNRRLEEDGVTTEVGVVKNHNGPFIACLGNRDGYYGGNQVETGGDCVLIKLYLDQVN